MVDIVVQRGNADRPEPDIVEPLLATVQAALARGRTEMDNGEPADEIELVIAPNDIRLGDTVGMIDPVAGQWASKVTGVQHSLEINDTGNMAIETSISVVVPRASRQYP